MNFLFKSVKQQFLEPFLLGKKLYNIGFRPNHAVSLWRGGTLIGLGINEFYRMQGLFINHTTMATSSYNEFEQREVIVKGIEHIIKVVVPEDRLLIIDDVFDTGETIKKIIDILKRKCRKNMPQQIKIATIDRKPEKNRFLFDLVYLNEIGKDVWINYLHEVSDLLISKDENYLLKRDKKAYDILSKKYFDIIKEKSNAEYCWATPEEIFYNSLKLGVNIFYSDFEPDYLIALWPGGVLSGVYVHEAYKYLNKLNGNKKKNPDHISINTTSSHLSYKSNIIGLPYLFDNINYEDKILIIDTVYKAGVHVNSVIDKLKEGLRRNLNHKNIRIATLYYNPKAQYTWTTKPYFEKPHYYLKEVNFDVIYPHAIHRLKQPMKEVKSKYPELYEIIWGERTSL